MRERVREYSMREYIITRNLCAAGSQPHRCLISATVLKAHFVIVGYVNDVCIAGKWNVGARQFSKHRGHNGDAHEEGSGERWNYASVHLTECDESDPNDRGRTEPSGNDLSPNEGNEGYIQLLGSRVRYLYVIQAFYKPWAIGNGIFSKILFQQFNYYSRYSEF